MTLVSFLGYCKHKLNDVIASNSRGIDRIGKYIDHVFETNFIYHAVFWLVFYFFLVIVSQDAYPLGLSMLLNIIRIIFYAVAVYVNLFYLFPLFLMKQQYWQYVSLLLLTMVIIAPMEGITMYFCVPHDHISTLAFLKNNFNSIFILTFFVASSSSIYKIINDWFTHQREKADLQNQSLKSELKYLKSQVNPHFLFNTLNSLYALTLKKSDLAPEIVLRLSEMMRYMLYECNERVVPLEKEINYIENYLELEKIRHGNKFEIKFTQNGNHEYLKIAPLMFMPFIENSFKHGLHSQPDAAYVNIQMDIQADEINLQVDNSRPPVMPMSIRKKSGGVGLVNVKRRLKLIYPSQHTLQIDKTPNSFHVNLKIELH